MPGISKTSQESWNYQQGCPQPWPAILPRGEGAGRKGGATEENTDARVEGIFMARKATTNK